MRNAKIFPIRTVVTMCVKQCDQTDKNIVLMPLNIVQTSTLNKETNCVFTAVVISQWAVIAV